MKRLMAITSSPRAITRVVGALEARALAIGGVVGGDEMHPGAPRRQPGRPGRRARAGMHDVDPLGADHRRPGAPRCARSAAAICCPAAAMMVRPPARSHLGGHAPAGAGHQRGAAGPRDGRGDLDRAALDPAAVAAPAEPAGPPAARGGVSFVMRRLYHAARTNGRMRASWRDERTDRAAGPRRRGGAGLGAAGRARDPTLVFLPGFRSDMTGTKALALRDWCAAEGRAMLRLDYSGHGAQRRRVHRRHDRRLGGRRAAV